jgi:glycosyltransferase involved in cell wall biosynthesis
VSHVPRSVSPALSVVIPTFNNEAILRRSIESWRTHAADQPVELLVVEDGCRDGTRRILEEVSATDWGQRHLRWIHLDDAHELRCTNAGFAAARGHLLAAWQDDMFLSARWLVPELMALFNRYPEIGQLGLSRGLNMFPVEEPIERWEDLLDWRRLQSTIGTFPWNWFRIQEVDALVRPWVIRRECLDRVGALDEAFVPTEWDEADLAFRLRAAGWKIATCGYERLGGYHHLGSSTVGVLSDAYKARVLRNGRLFHERWDDEILRSHARSRAVWARPLSPAGWTATALSALWAVPRRLTQRRAIASDLQA